MTSKLDAFNRAVAAWNAGDLDRYLDLYADDIALHGYSPEPMNKKEVRAFYDNIFDALSDVALDIHEVVEDETQLGCRFTMHGTHTGPLAGVAATGRRVSQPGITICVFDGEKVVQRYSVADFATVMEQITT